MTTTTVAAASPSTHRRSVARLCLLEAAQYLRSASMWVGIALTVLIAANTARSGDGRWPGELYGLAIPLAHIGMYLGVFIAGVRAGGRDQSIARPVLAEEAPLDRDDRAVARLAGLTVPFVLCIVVVAAITIMSRIEGGFWIGDVPRRTDTAVHSFAELLQPPLLVALFGAAGVAAGAAARRSAPAIIVGVVVWMITCVTSWAWQSNGVHLFALVQIQPMDIDVPAITDPTALPADWYAAAPGEYDPYWRHQIVHLPTVAWHNVYLVGLAALCCGLAIRRSLRQRIIVIGLAIAALGVVGQAVVSPF